MKRSAIPLAAVLALGACNSGGEDANAVEGGVDNNVEALDNSLVPAGDNAAITGNAMNAAKPLDTGTTGTDAVAPAGDKPAAGAPAPGGDAPAGDKPQQ